MQELIHFFPWEYHGCILAVVLQTEYMLKGRMPANKNRDFCVRLGIRI